MSILAEWFRGYDNIAMKCNGSILDHMPIPNKYRGRITDDDIESMRQAVRSIPVKWDRGVDQYFRYLKRELKRQGNCKNK